MFGKWSAFAVALVLIAAAGRAFGQTSLEYPIKATFLYKFGDFVSWPHSSEAYSICIIGRNPFGNVIDEVTAGERVGGRPIKVVRLESFKANLNCNVAYLGGVDDAALPAVLIALRESAVLSVTDEATNKAARGVIHFAVRQNRVRFFIDQQLAMRSQLAIRASLLALSIEPSER